MSNPIDATVTPLATEENTSQPVEKVTFIQKAKTFVKSHKKSTIAVGALVGLVGVAAVTGRKVADSSTDLELSPVYVGELTVPEENDVPVSQEN